MRTRFVCVTIGQLPPSDTAVVVADTCIPPHEPRIFMIHLHLVLCIENRHRRTGYTKAVGQSTTCTPIHIGNLLSRCDNLYRDLAVPSFQSLSMTFFVARPTTYAQLLMYTCCGRVSRRIPQRARLEDSLQSLGMLRRLRLHKRQRCRVASTGPVYARWNSTLGFPRFGCHSTGHGAWDSQGPSTALHRRLSTIRYVVVESLGRKHSIVGP